MKEFQEYDQMIAAYNQPTSDYIFPISSWEFYAEYNASLASFKYDFDKLRKIIRGWNFDQDIQRELVVDKSVIVITDPNLKIVYASHNMKAMNGYTPEEIVGCSPKMFQGKDTCIETSKAIRHAVDGRQPFEFSILNYKKNKTSYMCSIKGFPVHNRKGKLVNYIAFEKVA